MLTIWVAVCGLMGEDLCRLHSGSCRPDAREDLSHCAWLASH